MRVLKLGIVCGCWLLVSSGVLSKGIAHADDGIPDAEDYLSEGHKALHTRRWRDAEKFFETMYRKDKDPRALYDLMLTHVAQNDFKPAKATCLKAKRNHRDNYYPLCQAHAELGWNRTDRASEFLQLIKLDTFKKEDAIWAKNEVGFIKAKILSLRGKVRESAALLEKIWSDQQALAAQARFLVAMGQQYTTLREGKKARDSFGHILVLLDSHAEAAMGLGHCTRGPEGDKYLREAAALDKTWLEPREFLAERFERRQDWQVAATAWQDVLKVDEHYPRALAGRLLALSETKALEDARLAFGYHRSASDRSSAP